MRKHKYFISYYQSGGNKFGFGRCDFYSNKKIKGADELVPLERQLAASSPENGVTIISFQYVGRAKLPQEDHHD